MKTSGPLEAVEVCRPKQTLYGTMSSEDSINETPASNMSASLSMSPAPQSAGLTPLNNISNLNNVNSRRPPRKSTLTQQQKNQKRQRATQEQLTLLEVEFNKNPTPTAAVREKIAQDINMTERSVQIWFQNRSVLTIDPDESHTDFQLQTSQDKESCQEEHRDRRRV